MTITKLKRFGTLQKTFNGKGVMKFQDGTEVPAKFTFAQLANIDLVFTANINLPQWEFDKRETGIVGLFGKLSDDRLASAEGLFIKYIESSSSFKTTHITGFASRFMLGESKFEIDALISFEITNFLFIGNEFEKRTLDNTTESRRSLLNLQLANRKVALRQVDDYKRVEIDLKAQKKVGITCTATTAIRKFRDIEEVAKEIDTLCDLMSVARSTLITWTSYEVITQDKQVLVSNYRNSVTRNYSGSGLIGDYDIKNTKIFIEKAFVECEGLPKEYKVRQLARAYVETRSGGFLESRSMLIGVLSEYIASIQARLDNHNEFLPVNTFDSRLNEFISHVKDLFLATYPEVKPQHISTMINTVKGINRRPFSWKLNNLVKKFDIKVAKGDIEKIVNTRNKLAHEGRFAEGEAPVIQHLRMQHFIDKVILRLFDYHGSYYDMEHNLINEI